MSSLPQFARMLCRAAGIVALVAVHAASVSAQDPQPVLVVIDRDSIAHTQAPNAFTTQDVNEELAAVGMRDPLPYFRRNTGQPVTLRTGLGDNAGWQAPICPDRHLVSWHSESTQCSPGAMRQASKSAFLTRLTPARAT